MNSWHPQNHVFFQFKLQFWSILDGSSSYSTTTPPDAYWMIRGQAWPTAGFAAEEAKEALAKSSSGCNEGSFYWSYLSIPMVISDEHVGWNYQQMEWFGMIDHLGKLYISITVRSLEILARIGASIQKMAQLLWVKCQRWINPLVSKDALWGGAPLSMLAYNPCELVRYIYN